MDTQIVVSLLLAHYVGDFILQSDKVAVQKSRSWGALTQHVALYSGCFVWMGLTFALVTFVCHFLVDAATSRVGAKLFYFERRDFVGADWYYVAEKRRPFWLLIGFDQWIHYTQLVMLADWLS